MKIHTFGQVIPYNPDNLPERSFSVGAGTERPVGFASLELIARLYWTVRSFRFAISAVPLFDFTFEAFLMGGGSSGTIIGSSAGLATAAMTQPIPILLSGRTKILHVFNKKVRRVRDGVYNNLTQEEFFQKNNQQSSLSSSSGKPDNALDIDPDVDPNYLGTTFNRPSEGIFVSPGGYHSFNSSFGSVFINFSDIIYARRQYWPKVMIFMQNPAGGASFRSAIAIRDPLFSASLKTLPGKSAFTSIGSNYNVVTIGGASFLGGLIPMYGQGSGNTYSIFGAINIGTRCCDRYYFDGEEDQNRDCYEEPICGEGPQGVYREDIFSTNTKISS